MLKIKLSILKLTMKIIALVMIAMTFSSCEIIGDIFKAGMWTGVIIIAIIIILLIYIFSRFRRRE
jgi:membrane protein implicated in regulation of membrane protease activity